ncbi:hypothetical protein C0995_002477 [Termitomyces sp. Mi166|nr:hypothetical protein C0995_002477 [Termitomyces sp. Mi166\
MAPKISLLNVFPDACLLERELAAQKFIVAADAVFLKVQGLATLAPLHKMAFGLLEGLLDDWHLLNLTTIEWLHKAEVHQACINIWSLNKQAPWAAEFGKMVVLRELVGAKSLKSMPKHVSQASKSLKFMSKHSEGPLENKQLVV